MDNIEKGYFRVSVPQESATPTVSFINKFSGRCGKIVIRWKIIQPFSIVNSILSFGKETEKTEALYRFYRLGDRLLLPGSSLKGMARTYTAAVFGLTFADELYGYCDYGIIERDADRRNKRINHASKVFFEDVFIDEKALTKAPTMAAFSKNKAVPGTFRIYKLARSEEMKTRSFPIECLPPGTFFDSEIQYVGLLDEHLSGFLLSLGLQEHYSFPLKCGRGKSTGYGALKASVLKVLEFDRRSAFSPLIDITEVIKGKLTQTPGKIAKKPLENLEILRIHSSQ